MESEAQNFEIRSIEASLDDRPSKRMNGKIYFIESDIHDSTNDSLDRIKGFFKRFPRLYRFLIKTVSPVLGNERALGKFKQLSGGTIINLGSGNSPRQKGVVNIDLFDYDNVDLVCDIHDLPFRSGSLDSVMSTAVLEHVRNPEKVIAEIHRILKKGGLVYSCIPFMQPFHASPHDYQRYTLPGIEYLHRDFEIVDSGVCGGPVS